MHVHSLHKNARVKPSLQFVYGVCTHFTLRLKPRCTESPYARLLEAVSPLLQLGLFVAPGPRPKSASVKLSSMRPMCKCV
eukprot:5332263-Amphidinium_carterae.1